MDYNNTLEILERRIKHAVQILQSLSEENRMLKNDNQELLSQLRDKDITIERVKQECKKFKKSFQVSQQYAEKEEKVKERLEAMLSKLDEMQSLA